MHHFHYKDMLFDLCWNKVIDSGYQPQGYGDPPHLHAPHLPGHLDRQAEREAGPLPHDRVLRRVQASQWASRYRSSFSHKQILRYCMRALVSQGKEIDNQVPVPGNAQGSQGPLRWRVHRTEECKAASNGEDLQHGRERVATANRYLGPIVAIDAKNPKAEDWEVMKEVREVLVQSSDVPPVVMPTQVVCHGTCTAAVCGPAEASGAARGHLALRWWPKSSL